MSLSQAILNRIRDTRSNQSEAAQQLGVSQQTVSRWVSGTTDPRPEHYDALCAFLGVDQQELLGLLAHRDRITLDDVARGLNSLSAEVDDLRSIVVRLIARLPDQPTGTDGAGRRGR